MEDPIASSPEGQRFVEAVQSGDTVAAWNVFYLGDRKLKKYCVKYLINSESPRLVELIKGADDDGKKWMLRVILVHFGQPLLDKCFGEIKPSNDLLRNVAEQC